MGIHKPNIRFYINQLIRLCCNLYGKLEMHNARINISKEAAVKKADHLHHLYSRLILSISIGFLSISAVLVIGMCGYHYLEYMSWVDAFANASMILSGMGPLQPLNTTSGKIFAGCYAIFSGLFFILIIALIFSPLIHHFFVKIHAEYK